MLEIVTVQPANFGGLEWSPDERFIAYVAEPKPAAKKGFYAPKDSNKKDDGNGDKPAVCACFEIDFSFDCDLLFIFD